MPTDNASIRLWRHNRVLALQRDNYQCTIRGPHCTVQATGTDQVIPAYLGGTEDLCNLESTCNNCCLDRSERNRSVDEERKTLEPEPRRRQPADESQSPPPGGLPPGLTKPRKALGKGLPARINAPFRVRD